MLRITQQNQLAQAFEKWTDENGTAKTPKNVIAWLVSCDMINENKVVASLQKRGYISTDEMEVLINLDKFDAWCGQHKNCDMCPIRRDKKGYEICGAIFDENIPSFGETEYLLSLIEPHQN